MACLTLYNRTTLTRSFVIENQNSSFEKAMEDVGEMIAKRKETFTPDNHHDPMIDEEPKENPIRYDPKIRTRVRIRVNNTKEDVLRKNDLERKMKDHAEGKQKLVELLTAIEKRLSPSEKRSYTSLCNDFKFSRLAYSEFTRSLLLLIKKYKDLYQGFRQVVFGNIERQEDEVEESQDDKADTDIKEGKIQEDNVSDPKIGTGLKIKINLVDKKKRGILIRKDSNNQTDHERPLKKTKTLKRYERGSPSYRLIPKEERSPVSSEVLNNKYILRKVSTDGDKELLTDIEDDMKECEDQIYETDMVVKDLESAVEKANKVLRGEIRFDDLEVKFYRCIEQMYDGDIFEIVRKYRQRALPLILKRLNQKLLEVKAIRETLTKQRESLAQDYKVKVKKTRIRF